MDNILDINRVIKIENKINPRRIKAEIIEEVNLLLEVVIRKIDIIAIKVGNLPLQGAKTLVKIAINFSFLDLIIRQPITPQALQPYPIHIVSDCFPWAPHFLNTLSRLKAILGK